MSYGVIEGMKKVYWALAENEIGHSWEVEFDAVIPAIEESPQFASKRGRVTDWVTWCLTVIASRPR
ncbi:hypothetical protein [Halioxenophilus aromaticivorans]|uniref:hypothetical protein n=1 Tax=Halioxenophilus aromaticivorans TaxID=1306992 RepID=UPI0031EA9521